MNLKKLCIIMIKRGCTHIFSAHTGNTQSLEILKTGTCEHVFHVLGTENTEKFLSLKRQKMCFYEEKIFKIFYTEQWKHVYAIFLSVLSTCFHWKHWKHWALGAEKSKFVKRPFYGVFRRKKTPKNFTLKKHPLTGDFEIYTENKCAPPLINDVWHVKKNMK